YGWCADTDDMIVSELDLRFDTRDGEPHVTFVVDGVTRDLEYVDGSWGYVETDDTAYCGNCDGSGEGMYDGSRCGLCGGSGELYTGDDEPPTDPRYSWDD